jgi:DNA-binding winged helix-turn-helix (wHTH) protein/tetratricopeptide (TPR) repeat protein
MDNRLQIEFPPFRLDVSNERLHRGDSVLALRPKSMGVLRYLLEHPGRLVKKDELLDAIWPDTAVTDALLKGCVREIRAALDDDPSAPQFIETAHRRGYRFIGQVSRINSGHSPTWPGAAGERLNSSIPATLSPDEQLAGFAAHEEISSAAMVGRDRELAALQAHFEKTVAGDRQTLFLTGEPGIGKTTLVEGFLRRLANSGALIARGQCLEQYGAGEPYLPVLDAVSRLCRDGDSRHLVATLGRYAPTWLAQMPPLTNNLNREELQRELIGATPERMLREMAEATEALAAVTPLVLVLEDLHWSDYSTLDLIAALSRRPKPARIMLVGTYRPADVIHNGHPIRAVQRELQMHAKCREMAIAPLTEDAVGEYLTARLPVGSFSQHLSRLIYRRTEGHPLFMVSAVDYLLDRGLLSAAEPLPRTDNGASVPVSGGGSAMESAEIGVPENIRQMITQQIERLSEEDVRLLEAASVAGNEFSAMAVAAALEENIIAVEERCESLARRHQFLQARGVGEWPDGTIAARYGFVHSLYQNVLYQRLPAARLAGLHLKLGERGEAAFGERGGEIAAELAMHFERGRDYPQAIKYLKLAVSVDLGRCANREAMDHLARALELVEKLQEPDRSRVKLELIEQRGFARRSKGDLLRASEDFETIADLAHVRGLSCDEGKAMVNLASTLSWIDRDQCLAAIERAGALEPRLEDETMRAHIRGWAGYWNLLWRSWREHDAVACAEGIEAARLADRPELSGPLVIRHCFIQSLQSNYQAACLSAEEGLKFALSNGNSSDYLLCSFFYGWALLHSGRWGEMLRVVDEGIRSAEQNGHRLWEVLFRLQLSWLYQQAFDFDRARYVAERSLYRARKFRISYGEMMGCILLGGAHRGLEEHDRALLWLGNIRGQLERERFFMDWVWRMPLLHEMSQCFLALGELDLAREHARALYEVASLPRERTWKALAIAQLVEIAMAVGDLQEAEEQLGLAFETIDGADAPLAEWRVFATAACLNEQLDRKELALLYWTSSAETLHRLAESIGDEPLRSSILNHRTVRTILACSRGLASSLVPA